MKRNVLRELLNEDKPSIGTHCHVLWPGIAEVIGHSGAIDYIEFVGEYAPYDLYSLENFGRAVALFDHMSAMMKIEQQPRTYLAVRAVGSGIQNLLFADIRTVDDAKESVASSRPEIPGSPGIVGVGMRRDVGYVVEGGTPEYVAALNDTVVALMIEKQSCVENLEQILSIGGVDMVQFGPGDYSMSIGMPGQWDNPKVKEAEKFTIETALRLGIAPRVEISTFQEAEPYMDMGVKHFSIGSDVNIIYDWCKEQGSGLAKLLGR